MPRKPKTQARNRAPRSSAPSKKRIYQCLYCGALVDPIYGTGERSWCPDCHKTGGICYDEGQIPDPAIYGAWQAEQKKKPAENPESSHKPISTPTLIPGGLPMRSVNYHSGTFHCPKCCVDFDLIAEEALKCDRCGSPLYKGSIADWEYDEDGNEGEDRV